MLLYHDGHFIQLFEGDETLVNDLCRKIEKHSRHHTCSALINETIEERPFPEWSMGFHAINARAAEQLEGFNSVASSNSLIETSRHTVKVLLSGFKTINQI
jgi:catalase